MYFLTDPFLWAFVSMFALLAGIAFVSGIKIGGNAFLGTLLIGVNDLTRIVLVLPFCPQPRFDLGVWNWILGGAVLAAALAFGVPALSINWRKAPDQKTVLKTNGIYRIVRNPIYLADLLFALGFSVMFGSIVGLVLMPVWWLSFLLIALVEEKTLERALGKPYLAYKRKVKSRIIPGLPF